MPHVGHMNFAIWVVILNRGSQVAGLFVVADTSCTIKAASNHATPGFILLIAMYYVLNLEYPKVYSQLLGLIQKYVVGNWQIPPVL